MSTLDQWTAIDRYFTDLLHPTDPVLDGALAASERAGLPSIAVTPAQGKFLQLLARLCGARRILEIGTLGGYSTIWLARALPPGGRLVTLECEPRHADVAHANFVAAGLTDRIELHVGQAIEKLPQLQPPFDFIFIDADKPSTSVYFEWAIRLPRPGGVIIVDNVVREGEVINAASTDESVQGIRTFMQKLSTESRVAATAMQTVGSKGYDGFAIAVVQ